MADVLLRLLPVVVVCAVTPAWILVVLLLLQSEHGLGRSIAFVAGVTLMHVPLALICGALFGDLPRVGMWLFASPLVSLLLTLAGLGLLVTAAYTALHSSDPQAPPARWLTALDRLSPLAAFGMGLLLVFASGRTWLGVLLALAVIGTPALRPAQQLAAFVVFTLGSELLLVAPLVVRLVAPERARTILHAWTIWLNRHSRALMVGISLIFGVFFLWSGLTME